MIREVDAIIIGSGAAGLAAAVSLKKAGIEDVLVVDRDEFLGGILMQCIHNGFGLHKFKAELTGPEYAERYIRLANDSQVKFLTKTIATDIKNLGMEKSVTLLSPYDGLVDVRAKAVILAMGCRERSRGSINIPGSRPAGIMTAGLAQKFMNIDGYLPGKEIVILGSGDIGLIMARRLTWEGAHVKAVVEIQPYPGGLNRNIVQCLHDFDIPLYLSHTVTEVKGNKRIEAVEVSPINIRGEHLRDERFTLTCDTLLLSVGLIPENELSIEAGIDIDSITGGPIVDNNFMTSISGVFACGNVLHVHDVVDWASEEAERCSEAAASYIKGQLKKSREIPVRAGNLIRYVLPLKVEVAKPALLSLRPVAPAENAVLYVNSGSERIYKRKFLKIFPSEMLRIPLKKVPDSAGQLEISFALEEK